MSTKKMFIAALAGLVLSFAAAISRADEMQWDVKQNGHSLRHETCTLRDGITLKRGHAREGTHADFIETKHLTCKEGNRVVFSQTVACGPEGSLTRFHRGKGKVLVVCHTVWFASK